MQIKVGARDKVVEWEGMEKDIIGYERNLKMVLGMGVKEATELEVCWGEGLVGTEKVAVARTGSQLHALRVLEGRDAVEGLVHLVQREHGEVLLCMLRLVGVVHKHLADGRAPGLGVVSGYMLLFRVGVVQGTTRV